MPAWESVLATELSTRHHVTTAAWLSPAALESLLEQGIKRGHYTIPTLWAHARRLCRRGRTGSGQLATVLAAREPWRRPARSDHELRLERAMRRRGFPPLTRERPLEIAPGRVIHPDLGLPELWTLWQSILGAASTRSVLSAPKVRP
jgi:hypothetical protein